MAARNILSVDTAYDDFLRKLAASRLEYYNSQNAFAVRQLSSQEATREALLELCAARTDEGIAEYDCLAISSHGTPGAVFGQSIGQLFHLISLDDSSGDLTTIATGRHIYILACETAQDGDLPERLLDCGAELVAGYQSCPAWGNAGGFSGWRRRDVEFLKCFEADDITTAFRQTRSRLLEQLEQTPPNSLQHSKDLKSAAKVISSMIIQTPYAAP